MSERNVSSSSYVSRNAANQMLAAMESVVHTLGQVPQPMPAGYIEGMIASLLDAIREYHEANDEPYLMFQTDYGTKPDWMPQSHWDWLGDPKRKRRG